MVVVASQNRVKISAVHGAIKLCLPELDVHVSGMATASGVPDQPFGDDETLLGARNRLDNLRRQLQLAASATCQEENRLLVAIEGGVGQRAHDQRLECFAWVAVGSEASRAVSTARSGSFILPPALEELVKGGMELGAADDELFQRTESGKGSGTVGRLTNGGITRTAQYEQAVAMGLIPFLNPHLYLEGHVWL
ncbi:hypothetical protein FOA52_009577 [Chlamydomonas sp. UWO 241]|nr:hypothetical protein FOA52_009577 [Chlamydomonas sp. UWO 241]